MVTGREDIAGEAAIRMLLTDAGNARSRLFWHLARAGVSGAEADRLVAALEAGAVAGARDRIHRFEWEVPPGRGSLYEAGWDSALAASGAELVRIANWTAHQRWSAGPELNAAGSSSVLLQSPAEGRAIATAVLEWDQDGWVDTGLEDLAVQLLTSNGDSGVDAEVRWLAIRRPQGVTAMLLPLVRDIAADRAQDIAQLPLTPELARCALASLGLDDP